MKWARENTEDLQDKFREFSGDVRLTRVLQDVFFSDRFTAEALNSFIHLSSLAPIQSNLKQIKEERKLKVFLSYSSDDIVRVKSLSDRLRQNGADVWLAEERILAGEDWKLAIIEALRMSDVICICLSRSAVANESFVRREIKLATDISEEKPDYAIFIVPILFEPCDVPVSLSRYHWVELFSEEDEEGYVKILRALKSRASSLGMEFGTKKNS